MTSRQQAVWLALVQGLVSVMGAAVPAPVAAPKPRKPRNAATESERPSK
jgi:hypothetical protein